MNYGMVQYAIETAKEAYYYNKNGEGISDYIRTRFDNRYNKYWQCIVGFSFSSRIWHNPNEYINFNLGQFNIVLFRDDEKK